MTFVNLHLHSLYSKQDSVIKLDDLADKLVEYKQNACAITDHSSTAGHFLFNKECQSRGIKPIFGIEFYLNENYEIKSRDRDHLVCLAMNDEGVINLNKLQNEAVNHFYYKPILSYNSLKDYSYGLYATSACSLGIISKMILEDNMDKAWDYADWFMEIFDGNFSLELQFHPQYEDQYIINDGLLRLHELSGIPLTVSTDAHFIDRTYMETRKCIKAISYKQTYNEAMDSLYSNCVGTDELVFRFAYECDFDLNVVEDAVKQTEKIANMCNANLCSTDRKVPVFDRHEEFDKLFEEFIL